MSRGAADDLGYQRRPLNNDLAGLPGDLGWPFVGNVFELLRDPYGLVDRLYRAHGPVARTRFAGVQSVMCVGAEVNRRIYLDPDGDFSAKMGYAEVLGQFYGGGLLMRDFDDHRLHRRLFQSAFKNEAMRHYGDVINAVMAHNMAGWAGQRDFRFFPAIKTTLLDIAAQTFLGIDELHGDEARRIAQVFATIADGMLGVVRWDSPLLPLSKWRRGKEAKRYMEHYLRSQIAARRAGDKRDLFSLVCRERDEQGAYFNDDDIAAHINFLLFAAHDTTTSNLCYIMQYLGQDPLLQQRARTESLALGKPLLDFDDLPAMVVMDRIHHEALRLHPPVMMMNRRTIREVELEGVRIPADAIISVFPQYTHRMAQHWDAPERFDPERFAPQRAEHRRHPFQYIPFGGGAHKCIGLHFAGMIVKCFMHQMLLTHEWRVPAGYRPVHQAFPLPKQADGLPLLLSRR